MLRSYFKTSAIILASFVGGIVKNTLENTKIMPFLVVVFFLSSITQMTVDMVVVNVFAKYCHDCVGRCGNLNFLLCN